MYGEIIVATVGLGIAYTMLIYLAYKFIFE